MIAGTRRDHKMHLLSDAIALQLHLVFTKGSRLAALTVRPLAIQSSDSYAASTYSLLSSNMELINELLGHDGHLHLPESTSVCFEAFSPGAVFEIPTNLLPAEGEIKI